jgi:hypothetical protein
MLNTAAVCQSADIAPVRQFIPDMSEHVRMYWSKRIVDPMMKLMESCMEWRDVHAIFNTMP